MKKSKEIVEKIFISILLISTFYLFGSLIFGYDLPEWLIHKKTPKEQRESFDNMKLPIKVSELTKLIRERDSLLKITKTK